MALNLWTALSEKEWQKERKHIKDIQDNHFKEKSEGIKKEK